MINIAGFEEALKLFEESQTEKCLEELYKLERHFSGNDEKTKLAHVYLFQAIVHQFTYYQILQAELSEGFASALDKINKNKNNCLIKLRSLLEEMPGFYFDCDCHQLKPHSRQRWSCQDIKEKIKSLQKIS